MDPVLKASAGYEFHDWEDGLKQLQPVLTQIDLITPNYPEMMSLGGKRKCLLRQKPGRCMHLFC